MTELRAFTFYAMIPLNLLLIVWVWIGRAFLGAGRLTPPRSATHLVVWAARRGSIQRGSYGMIDLP